VPSIIRVVHKERPFVMIDKETVRDLSADLQALGLLVVILSKPDEWRVRPEQLAEELKTGRASIYRVLDRLISSGYIVREDFRRRLPNGRFERRTSYTVYEDRRMVPKLENMDRHYDTKVDGMEVPF